MAWYSIFINIPNSFWGQAYIFDTSHLFLYIIKIVTRDWHVVINRDM